MKKNMYSVLLHFFLFVCLVIPLHTTANAANTTDDCLQILASDFNSNSAQEFIGTQHLNITDSQYQTIRTFTLDLTEKYSSTKDKITAIYQWARDTSLKASVGEAAPADLEENDPYKVFKEKTGVCQGKANLCKTMLAAIDVPCIIAHGYWETEGHAWDFVLCDGKWGIVDASMWQISLDDPSDISSHYKTDSLEAVLYEKDGFEFTYYLGGIGAVGYTGNAERLEIPESCNGYPVISIAAESQIYYEHSFQDTAAKELEVRPAVPDTNETEKPQPDTETPETHVPDQSGNTETPKPAAKPTAPAKVTGVKISYKKSGKAILGWKKVKNASGYEIYRYQNKRWVKVKKVGKKTSFVIKKRSRKTVYYRVRAFRKKGKNVSYGKYSRKVKCKALQKAK